MQCFRLALTANNDHAESYNNIGELFLERNIKARQNITLTGVLEMRKGHVEQARAFFQVDLVILLKFSILYIPLLILVMQY